MKTSMLLTAFEPTERAAIMSRLSSRELQEIVGYADTKVNLCKRIAEFEHLHNQIEITIEHHESI